MTKNPFFQANAEVPGGYVLSRAGILLLCSSAIHESETDQGKARAASMIRAVLDAARAAGYTRGEIAETILMDFGQSPERKQDAVLELMQFVSADQFIDAMGRSGMGVSIED